MRLVNILNRKQLFIEGMCKLRRKFLDYGTNLTSCCVPSFIGLKSFKVDTISFSFFFLVFFFFFFFGGVGVKKKKQSIKSFMIKNKKAQFNPCVFLINEILNSNRPY